METLISQRGKRLILYDDFKFRKSRKTLDGWLWRCTKKTCKSTLRLDDSETKIIRSEIHHNHEPTRICHKQAVSYQRKPIMPSQKSKWHSGDEETLLQLFHLLNPYYYDNAFQAKDNILPLVTNYSDFVRFMFLDKNLGKHFLLTDEEPLNLGIDLSISSSTS